MSPTEIRSLVRSGRYKPDPGLVAAAMLERRGVRKLLSEAWLAPSEAGRTPGAPAGGRPAG